MHTNRVRASIATRLELPVLLLGVCLAAPSATGTPIRCTTGRATACRQLELVPCADVRPEHLPTESEADVERARAVAARLVEWVAAKTGWSAREVPPIHFVPGAELARKFGRTPDEFHVEALYSDRDHSIYLANRWRPDDLRDRSLLLHELVHHLQYLNHVKPLCESRSEYQAFTLQARWLSEHGVEYPLDLMDVDPRLLMMLRHCDEMSY